MMRHIFISILASLILITLIFIFPRTPESIIPVIPTIEGGFETEILIENLDTPWAIDFLPSGEMIFTERPGRVNIFDGKTKTTHFGSAGMDDYTITKNKEQRKRYRSRHRKDLKTNDPTRAGYLAWHLLWGSSTSLRDNIRSYKKRFNFK